MMKFESIIRAAERVYDNIFWSPYSEIRDCIENKKLLSGDIAVKYGFMDILGVFPQAKYASVWEPNAPEIAAKNEAFNSLTLLLLLQTPNQTNTNWFDLKTPVPENYTGMWSRVISSSNIVELTTYEGGVEHGLCKVYDHGVLVLSCIFQFGHYDGRYEEWFRDGRPKMLCFYKNGNLNGKYRTWFPNMNLHQSCFYKDGKRVGMFISRYENGKPEMVCKYESDIMAGECIKYDKKGDIVFISSFNDEKLFTQL